MDKVTKVATDIILGLFIFTMIFLHIKFLCIERQDFAVGGEWILYTIVVVSYLLKIFDD